MLGSSAAAIAASASAVAPVAAVLEGRVDLGGVRARLGGEPPHELELVRRVRRELVHADDRLQAVAVDDPDVAREVRRADLDLRRASVEVAAVVLERSHGRDEHDRARSQVADATGDVEELLHAHVRREARLGHDVLAELEPDAIGDERVVAVRDVRERSAVDEGRLTLERLHEVRLDRVLEDDGHRAGGLDVLSRDRLALVRLPDGDPAEPLAQVGEVAGHGDETHDLARRGDVEAGLTRRAVRASTQARDDVPEIPVVHVHAAAPGDRERVEARPRSRGGDARRSAPRAGCSRP